MTTLATFPNYPQSDITLPCPCDRPGCAVYLRVYPMLSGTDAMMVGWTADLHETSISGKAEITHVETIVEGRDLLLKRVLGAAREGCKALLARRGLAQGGTPVSVTRREEGW